MKIIVQTSKPVAINFSRIAQTEFYKDKGHFHPKTFRKVGIIYYLKFSSLYCVDDMLSLKVKENSTLCMIVTSFKYLTAYKYEWSNAYSLKYANFYARP